MKLSVRLRPTNRTTEASSRKANIETIDEYTREVLQDRDANYWFGTNGVGICNYDSRPLSFLSAAAATS